MELESNAKTPMLTGSAGQQQTSSRGGVQTTVRLTPPNDQSMPRAVSETYKYIHTTHAHTHTHKYIYTHKHICCHTLIA